MPCESRIWAGLSIAAQADIDQSFILSRNVPVREPEPGHDTRTKTFDQNVRARGELEQCLLAGILLEIEHDALLAGIRTRKYKRVHRSGVIAFARLLDLDDLSAVVRQVLRRYRARQQARQIQNGYAFQSFHDRALTISLS